ncbi:MAG: OadG family transporter subunit [Kiritimatiellia bacterium]|jgi:sodium pump decarboxylase gamma subunit
MIKDATIVMILGMGTVFLVLLALLGLMTLGGRLAARFAPPEPSAPPPPAPKAPFVGAALKSVAEDADSQTCVAVAVAVARRRCTCQERNESK